MFQPSARRGEVRKGSTVVEASRQLGVDIEALCGEKKVCGKCRVRVEEGFFEKFGIHSGREHLSGWQPEEEKFITAKEREAGYRLGCCAKVQGDLLVFVPEESRAGKQVVSKAARDIQIHLDPAVRCYPLEVGKPTFERPTADLERVLEGLRERYGLPQELRIDHLALRRLPEALRKGNGKVTVAVWMDSEIIRVLPEEREDYYGLAVDVGTTTIAAYLCNLRTKEVVNTASMMNPQCKYGEDVMSRITYHMSHPDGLSRMSQDVVEGLSTLARQACEGVSPSPLTPAEIVDMTLVANTAMHHILLQIPPDYLGVAPFPPAIHQSLDIKARELGIRIHESAYLHVLPNEAGFVGADNVGVLVCEEPYKKDELQLIIDIGTNGELVLGNRERLISSSCATGPALEGAQLTFGMRAAPGAIERIRIDPETQEVDYKVIGRDAWRGFSRPEEMKTKGICGSGILDLLAELYRSGVILKSGRFNPEQRSSRYRVNPENQQPEFVIAWKEETSIGRDVTITQKDIRQIQLAKGALYSGCKIMMRKMGVDKVDTVKIAGAFGTHVDREKALIMGLFPDCPLEKVVSIGNAAGDGARMALLDRGKRKEANWVARNVEYVELTVEKDFQKEFMQAMHVPHMKDEFPHLKGLVQEEVLSQEAETARRPAATGTKKVA